MSQNIILYKRPSEYDTPSDLILMRYGLLKKYKKGKEKILFAASFDLNKMAQHRNETQIASFFRMDYPSIVKIKKMQALELKLKHVFPKEFPDHEDKIQTNGEWTMLKQQPYYKRLMNGN